MMMKQKDTQEKKEQKKREEGIEEKPMQIENYIFAFPLFHVTCTDDVGIRKHLCTLKGAFFSFGLAADLFWDEEGSPSYLAFYCLKYSFKCINVSVLILFNAVLQITFFLSHTYLLLSSIRISPKKEAAV